MLKLFVFSKKNLLKMWGDSIANGYFYSSLLCVTRPSPVETAQLPKHPVARRAGPLKLNCLGIILPGDDERQKDSALCDVAFLFLSW